MGFERLETANFHRDLHNCQLGNSDARCVSLICHLSFLVVATLIPVLNFYSEDLENWQQF